MSENVVAFRPPQRVRKGESRLIYIAAPFTAREEARRLKDRLEAAGHVTTSTWITSHLDNYENLTDDQLAAEANHDAEGVGRAEIVILLNNAGPSTSGGMHVEVGMALAWNKHLLIVGDQTNLFHHLPGVKVVDNAIVAVDLLDRYFPRPVRGQAPPAPHGAN